MFGAARKDRAAKKIVDEIARLNVMGVANIVELYDPELLILGGAVATNNEDAIMKPIVKGVGGYTARLNRLPKIVMTSLGDSATLYGAVADFL